MIELAWPVQGSPLLLWSQCVFVWTLVNYLRLAEPVGRDELRRISPSDLRRQGKSVVVRGVTGAVVMTLLPGISLSELGTRLALALLTLVLCLALPSIRWKMANSPTACRYLAEWEILGNGLFLVSSGLLVGTRLEIANPLVVLPLSATQLTATSFAFAAVIFISRGGTHLVRGILDKADTLPREQGTDASTSKKLDEIEYGRGQTIGNIERLLLLVMVVAGSYEGLAFLIAAKGLIRAKEFQNRDFAEYFIIGTLASLLVALAVGIALKTALAIG